VRQPQCPNAAFSTSRARQIEGMQFLNTLTQDTLSINWGNAVKILGYKISKQLN